MISNLNLQISLIHINLSHLYKTVNMKLNFVSMFSLLTSSIGDEVLGPLIISNTLGRLP